MEIHRPMTEKFPKGEISHPKARKIACFALFTLSSTLLSFYLPANDNIVLNCIIAGTLSMFST